jgi:hypothetical protein
MKLAPGGWQFQSGWCGRQCEEECCLKTRMMYLMADGRQSKIKMSLEYAEGKQFKA